MLYQTDTEMLFPPRVIPMLGSLRGAEWRTFIQRLDGLPEDHPDILSFTLMMIRLDSCMTCHADSYRAMRGCTLCAQQVITRYKGSDADLVRLWQQARSDIEYWQEKGIPPRIE